MGHGGSGKEVTTNPEDGTKPDEFGITTLLNCSLRFVHLDLHGTIPLFD
jgi:hypothetical protein